MENPFTSSRRPAVDIADDVRAYGAEMHADFWATRILVDGQIPAWLAREVAERQEDLIAIFQEFDETRSELTVAVLAAAGRLLRKPPDHKRSRSSRRPSTVPAV